MFSKRPIRESQKSSQYGFHGLVSWTRVKLVKLLRLYSTSVCLGTSSYYIGIYFWELSDWISAKYKLVYITDLKSRIESKVGTYQKVLIQIYFQPFSNHYVQKWMIRIQFCTNPLNMTCTSFIKYTGYTHKKELGYLCVFIY